MTSEMLWKINDVVKGDYKCKRNIGNREPCSLICGNV